MIGFRVGWPRTSSRGVYEGEDAIHEVPNLQNIPTPSMAPFRAKHLVCGVAQGPPSQNSVFLSGREKGSEKTVLI